MRPIASIHIITEPGTHALKQNHLIRFMGEAWKEAGHQISSGPADHLEDQLGFLHIDRTRHGPEIIPSTESGVPIINGNVLDISKRAFSELVLERHTDWDGPVILKTNANANGHPDLVGNPFAGLIRLRRKLSNPPWWHLFRHLPMRYPILASVKEVPGWIWDREDIVVEKLVCERDGENYAARIWLFFGSKSAGWLQTGRSPVIKSGRIIESREIDDVPPELHALRKAMKIDYGKIDYTMVDGKAVIYDVNKTPTVAGTRITSDYLAHLAGGIEEFLP